MSSGMSWPSLTHLPSPSRQGAVGQQSTNWGTLLPHGLDSKTGDSCLRSDHRTPALTSPVTSLTCPPQAPHKKDQCKMHPRGNTSGRLPSGQGNIGPQLSQILMWGDGPQVMVIDHGHKLAAPTRNPESGVSDMLREKTQPQARIYLSLGNPSAWILRVRLRCLRSPRREPSRYKGTRIQDRPVPRWDTWCVEAEN